MGCIASTVSDDDEYVRDKLLNDAIEQNLQMTRTKEGKPVKLLLLGAGESGKSTVLKQLKLIHKGGFTDSERSQYSQVIWADVIQSMKTILVNARRLGITLDCDTPGNELAVFKQIALKANALDHIDTDVAGGSNFLNDYVIKYSEGIRNKRRLNSTGVASGDLEAQTRTQNFDLNEELSDVLFESNKNLSRRKVAEAIHFLWTKDSGVRRCFDRSNEFQLESSAGYYFDNIFKFSQQNYMCSDMDILKGRIKTTGITETDFSIKNFKLKVLDAGGQRSERKKWIHCFENITAILFVLAISEYDQTLFEDERVNRMHEAIVLFDSLCNSKWFVSTPFILFMNKIDIFQEKLNKSPLKNYFPDYSGDPNDIEAAMKFFEKKFLLLNRTKKPIYVHRTCATDTQSMKFVLTAVTDSIVQDNLKKSGII